MSYFGECKNTNRFNYRRAKSKILGLCLFAFSFSLQAQTDSVYNLMDYVMVQTQDNVVDKNKIWLVKANLLQLGAGITNIGAEYSFDDRFSVDVPLTYSPYTIKRNYKLKTLSIQPELRWWVKEQLSGHFVGFHVHLAFYNIAINQNNRYQDRDGNTPLIGFGLSYGYALKTKSRWNIEFTLGIGYAHLDYDIFYNTHNGAAYSTESKSYFGFTKAGITLIYKLTTRSDD
jgi:hypothetical protein